MSVLLACSACSRDEDRDPNGDGNTAPDSMVPWRRLQFAPGTAHLQFGGGVAGLSTSVTVPVAGDLAGSGGADELVLVHRIPHGSEEDAGAPEVSLVSLTSGPSTRRTALECDAESTVTSLVAGRFDRGPQLDVVVNGCFRSSKLHLGSGAGSFTPGSVLPYESTAVAAGDVNGDGLDDLICRQFGGTAGVLLAVGDGTFKAAAQVALPVTGIDRVLVARLDGDGHLDLVVVEDGGLNSLVLLGAGDGTFHATPLLPVGFYPAVIGDFDGDGIVDVVSDDAFARGRGDGTFTESQPTGLHDMVVHAAADFDLDGRLDLAGNPRRNGKPEDAVFLVASGQGNGHFDAPVSFDAHSTLAGGDYDVGFRLLGVMDLDGNRKPDVYGISGFFEGAEITTRINTTR